MPLSKADKDKAANAPDRHTGFWKDKVDKHDANPAHDNLANKKNESEKVTAGRELPKTADDSAPQEPNKKA